ncbi:Phosphoenolpyruvate carboxylase [Granulibacter bethesdensis]|uniref:Phosphoenolpyruvate carboxylase n=2 Tax=Granulibacter bethesdensis TaxID=364410 RepID=A0AAC9P924_9PROT|nr:Phosphoenolpyruvate carboxylase [Granulibacter bethesdensis]APH62220.1 Phosphoenolpyruvate carboxylase [Granulibacter bethesdensis]
MHTIRVMADMHDTQTPANLAAELLSVTERSVERSTEDPFGNPMLSVALAIARRIESGSLSHASLVALVKHLRDAAYIDRARRLANYVGGIEGADEALAHVAQRVVRPDPNDSPISFRDFQPEVERTRFAAVFTAHPTFSMPAEVGHALAEAASGAEVSSFESHRPPSVTLEDEFDQAVAAIINGRDAIDKLNRNLLLAARDVWPDRWSDLTPRPVILTSWVGYDTDGRTDIGWWDTLRLRLRMKRLQLERVLAQLAPLAGTDALQRTVNQAIEAVSAQIEACPMTQDPDGVQAFAQALITRRQEAITDPAAILPQFDAAISTADEETRLALCVIRAGLVSHAMSLAHTHVRLNATQLHNVARQRLGITDPPEDQSRRRILLSKINEALDTVQPVNIDFGTLIAEQASAARLMMTVAQVVKHIDSAAPVRFLIAETESGYTLLTALWLARLLGIEDRIEISPLFETADALEQGARILQEALRSPHYRAYLQKTGRLALQFGYSDSGRYVGQLAASYLIERLRMKIAELLARYDVKGVEVILFDTHGESIGRGAHPGSLYDRLKYLSPTKSRKALRAAGVVVREESAFQGGDGYLLFGTPALATATIARIAEHAFPRMSGPKDPVYEEQDFASDYFTTIRTHMEELVEDPGYAALLGAFGPALIDKTGSRPAARQSDGAVGRPQITHPRELRAIPNNAILQQLGWCANSIHGIGAALIRHPETFDDLYQNSFRFRRAMNLAEHALRHSDLDVLRAVVATFDPTTWLDRAAHERETDQRKTKALMLVAKAVERLGLAAVTQAMFRRIQVDHLQLRAGWSDAPRMTMRERLLHALRLALIHRIWLLETEIPDFSPRHGVTRQALEALILRLEIPLALNLLSQVFPPAPDPAVERDYFEPSTERQGSSYAHEHATIFQPMSDMFDLVREIGTAISHEVGAFG